MIRRAEDKGGEIEETSFPLPEKDWGVQRGKIRAKTQLQIGLYSPPTPTLENNHTY